MRWSRFSLQCNFLAIIPIEIYFPITTSGLSNLPSKLQKSFVSNDEATKNKIGEKEIVGTGRRDVFAKSTLALGTIATILPKNAIAFDNAIPEAKQYADRPKRPGTPPKDLGIRMRTTEGKENLNSVTVPALRTCDGNPNCFSTTGDYELADRTAKGIDFLIPPWKPPADDKNPLRTIAGVISTSYQPGQGGIDGGGFSLVKEEKDKYLYYKFESLKKGYIDDVEFAISTTGPEILVRSASRVGYTDFGVNALRLNYIAAMLRKKDWVIAEITPDTHRDYWLASDDAREATFDSDRRKMDGGENVKETVAPSNVFTR